MPIRALMAPLRRSVRLQGLSMSTAVGNESSDDPPRKKRKVAPSIPNPTSLTACLGRPRETILMKKYKYVLGIDEAGRGPLAGPVVAAAALVPKDIAGVMDSKKIKEDHREALYERIIGSDKIRWAVAVVDAATIDEINILQATLLGMRMAAEAVLTGHAPSGPVAASVDHTGCYVVTGSVQPALVPEDCVALVDGNRLPKDMPCEAEAVVKGDSKEYSIAAASILAKVTRDRLMHDYAKLYPKYDWHQNKGYPTAAHMAAVRKFGASAIHRRTFAPLKYMDL